MSNNTNTTKIEVSIVNGVETIEVTLFPEGGVSPAQQAAINAGDAALQAAINAEATTRQTEGAALQTQIDAGDAAEAVMRAAGDAALQAQITANKSHEHLAGVVDTSYFQNTTPPGGPPTLTEIQAWSVDPATQIEGAKFRVGVPGVRGGIYYPAGMIVEVKASSFVAYGWNPVGPDGKITEVAAEKTAREAWQSQAVDQFSIDGAKIAANEQALSALINDDISSSLVATWSIDKIQSTLTTAINNLVNGAPGALDTLNELAAALQANDVDISAILTAQANRVRVDAAQEFTEVEMGQARANMGAASAVELASESAARLAGDKYNGTFKGNNGTSNDNPPNFYEQGVVSNYFIYGGSAAALGFPTGGVVSADLRNCSGSNYGLAKLSFRSYDGAHDLVRYNMGYGGTRWSEWEKILTTQDGVITSPVSFAGAPDFSDATSGVNVEMLESIADVKTSYLSLDPVSYVPSGTDILIPITGIIPKNSNVILMLSLTGGSALNTGSGKFWHAEYVIGGRVAGNGNLSGYSQAREKSFIKGSYHSGVEEPEVTITFVGSNIVINVGNVGGGGSSSKVQKIKLEKVTETII